MKLNCIIDDSYCSLNVNADKPLNCILEETVESFSSNSKCLGADCGNCLVLVNGVCTFSCLVPAFKLSNSSIQTYEGFSKTRNCHDIERAYRETGIHPCRQCYASKTLLIESLLQKMDEDRVLPNSAFIAKEMSINKCRCIDSAQLEKVIHLAHLYRSRRHGKA